MGSPPQIAIVGGESLLGNDLRDLLSGSILGKKLKLIGSEEEEVAILSQQGGEPVVITPNDEETLASSQLVIFAGSTESTTKAFTRLKKKRPILIDLTHTFEDHPDACLRAPSAEPPDALPPSAAIHVIAHPAAIMLAAVLRRLHAKFPILRAAAQVFEPASEHGRAGIEELHRQTVELFSFKPYPKRIFDAQLAFNLLAQYGEEAPLALSTIQDRVDKHLKKLLNAGTPVPIPSLRLVQAPVMHGLSISLWMECGSRLAVEKLQAALSSNGIDIHGADLEPPNNVGMAGQDGVAIGAVEVDRNHPNAAWLWIVGDNFRISAGNGIAVARTLLLEQVVS